MSEDSGLLDPALAWAATQMSRASEAAWAGYARMIEVTREWLAFPGLNISETAAAWIAGGSILIAVAALVQRLSARSRRRAEPPGDALAAITRSPRRLGLAAVVVFVSVLGGWSALAPLASAALAPGVISPDGHRKTIQHLEGGIIRAIHVREGDRVQAGEPLITLDDIRARALDAEIRERLLHVLATDARLEAERTASADIDFPEFLLREGSKGVQQVMEGQRQLLESRRATHEGRTGVLQSRVRQLHEQNLGLKEVIVAQDRQIALIDEEIESAQDLLDKGLERKSRVLALRRARAEISAEKAANRAKIAENEQAIGETQLQLLTVAEERQEKINAELADVRRVLAELRGQLPSREDILARTVIRAPIAGRVMNVHATTESGVVGPGEPLLDIVPDDGQLIIDARVSPTDVERISPGMSARVVLTAYRQRTLPLIRGQLRSISADALIDERTGQSYFLAKVEVAPDDLAKLEEVQLIPGMPAEVMLMDGEQSLFGYLLGPILDSARRSLREV